MSLIEQVASLQTGRGTFKIEGPAGMDGDSEIVKTYEVGCCFFAPKHHTEEAIRYYGSTLEVDKVVHLKKHLKGLERLFIEIREHILKTAIEICKDFEGSQDLEELHAALQEHFRDHIRRFRRENNFREALRLEKHLEKLDKKILGRESLKSVADITAFLNREFSRKIARGDDQVYEAETQLITGKDLFPGKLIRQTGDEPCGDSAVDRVFAISEEAPLYAQEQGIDFHAALHRMPRISSVHKHEYDNAYWNRAIMQIVVGDGHILFKNLATTEPGNRSVIIHEWWHMLLDYVAGSALHNGITGLDYVCKGQCDAGALNEAGADIGAISHMITFLEKEIGHVDYTDPRIKRLFYVGLNLWKMIDDQDEREDNPNGIRHAVDGIGWTDPRITSVIGRPVERNFVDYTAWHDNKGVVVNYAVDQGLIKGDHSIVDPHHGSACPLAAFAYQVKFIGSAKVTHHIWLEALTETPFRPSLPRFADLTVKAVKIYDAKHGTSYEHHIRNGWRHVRVPVSAP